jgi:hypothetical protein
MDTPVHPHTLLVIYKPCSLLPRLADLPGVHLDKAALVILVNGQMGVMNLRTWGAFARDAAWKQLFLRAQRLGVLLLVLWCVGHFWLQYM